MDVEPGAGDERLAATGGRPRRAAGRPGRCGIPRWWPRQRRATRGCAVTGGRIAVRMAVDSLACDPLYHSRYARGWSDQPGCGIASGWRGVGLSPRLTPAGPGPLSRRLTGPSSVSPCRGPALHPSQPHLTRRCCRYLTAGSSPTARTNAIRTTRRMRGTWRAAATNADRRQQGSSEAKAASTGCRGGDGLVRASGAGSGPGRSSP